MATNQPARNEARYRAAVELRRSNAATPIPSGSTYRRRAKHRHQQVDREEL